MEYAAYSNTKINCLNIPFVLIPLYILLALVRDLYEATPAATDHRQPQ